MEKSGRNNDEVTITRVAVKKENLSDDIKEFAETAMNELLGWYGYESTREDLKITRNCRTSSHSDSINSNLESPQCPPSDGCGWCGKAIEEQTGLTSGNAVFCSELCFSQSRRANFKKNKTCDWCRHVRHTVSYVDFQDGASQLQFCSDKCLNQYKMHIFCRETRAHLELHPHLNAETSSAGTLITPDLWLKNCKSPEPRSPTPPPPPTPPSPKSFETPPQTSPLPLVSLTHPSKLMAMDSTESKRHRLKAQKKTKKRFLPATITASNNNGYHHHHSLPPLLPLPPPPSDTPQDLRIRHTPTPDLEVKEEDKTNKQEQTSNPANGTTPDHVGVKKFFDTFLPPPTVVVPYPIFLPLPLPIPIPIPIPMKKEVVVAEKKDLSVQTETIRTEDDVVKKTKIDTVKCGGRLLRKRIRSDPKTGGMKTRRILSNKTN